MRLPRNLDGVDLAQHLVRRWDYVFVKQTGSHMKLQTTVPFGHTATIPAHRPLKPGTLSAILSEIAGHKNISRDEILRGL